MNGKNGVGNENVREFLKISYRTLKQDLWQLPYIAGQKGMKHEEMKRGVEIVLCN